MRLFGTPHWMRRMAPSGLLGRSLLIIMVPMILLQVVTAVVFYERHWDTVMRRLAIAIAGDLATVRDLLHDAAGDDTRRARAFRMARHNFDLMITVDRGATLPPGPWRPEGALEEAMLEAIDERVRLPARVQTGFLQRELHIQIQLPEGVMSVVAPRKRLFSSTTYIFVMWVVGTALVLFGLATLFMTNQVRSIRRLAAGADDFGKGRDREPLKPEGAREVRQAAAAFNQMRDRIRRQMAQRTEMLAGVSHDLRTPLTRMKLGLAMLQDVPEAGQEVHDLEEDVHEMERMIEAYLAFARGEAEEAAEPVDLAALIGRLAARFAREGRPVALEGPVEVPLVMPLRIGAIERCLSNLLTNALRHGTRVRVTLSPRAQVVEVMVEDDGPGIPTDQREMVFRAFTRLEKSRNPKTGGTGLGLTIARDVARGHGGDVVLEDSPALGGLLVRLRLPR